MVLKFELTQLKAAMLKKSFSKGKLNTRSKESFYDSKNKSGQIYNNFM